MSPAAPLHLFEGWGIEIEYMIVDRKTLDVRPLSDRVLREVAGTGDWESEVEVGALAWSNELVLHVIELKTNGPARSLRGLHEAFQADVRRIDELLAPEGARLMPTGMHPWMDPHREMHLWPHDYSPVYETYHRIFDCRGHGWANLQSMHVNLPFSGDEEFGRLHAAIRLVLPLLPALAASTPVMDGRATGVLDNRLAVYKTNSRRVPRVAGRVVPEPVFTRAGYEDEIFGPLFEDIAPLDPEGVLRHEWLNARGAIARFDRMAIEIRVLDSQECPRADIAVAALVGDTVRALVEERWSDSASQRAWPTEELADLFDRCLVDAEATPIENPRYLEVFGLPGASPRTAGEVWRHLLAALPPEDPEHGEPLRVITERGTLARRILSRLGAAPERADLARVWGEIADCLAEGRMLL